MNKSFERRLFFKLFVLGIVLILLQTILQNNSAFLDILKALKYYVKPFIYGIFIAILFNPSVSFLEKKFKLSRVVSLWIIFFIFILLLVGALFWFIPNLVHSFEDIIHIFPILQEKFTIYLREIFQFLREKDLLLMNGADLQKAIEDFFVSNVEHIKNILFSISLNVVYWIAEIFIFFLGLFLAIYFIIYERYFMGFFRNIVFLIYDENRAEKACAFIVECKNIFLNYISGRIFVSFIVGLVAYIVMKFGNVPYTLIISVMIGVGNMIPYFGSIVAGAIAFLLVVLVEPMKVWYIFLAMGIAQAVDGYVVGPLILSKSVGLSSFWIIASVIIMGNIMGTTGMFLGVPIFAILKLIYTKLVKKKREELNIENKTNNDSKEC